MISPPLVTDTYSPQSRLSMYPSAKIPDLPSIQNRDTYFAQMKTPAFGSKARKRMAEDPLGMCYERAVPYDTSSPPITITLATPLATGARKRPVQVWTATLEGSAELLVARLYDPLYFESGYINRFRYIENAVAIEHECYSRLKDYAGVVVPHLIGVFVAEIPGPAGSRYIYAVLLKYVEGSDVRSIMAGGVGDRTCSRHQAAIVDAAARNLYLLFRHGIRPMDVKDNNAILRVPRAPSQEQFCAVTNCPFRNLIHIDFNFDPAHLEPPTHLFAPRLALIDMEYALFYSQASWVGEADIQQCRNLTIRHWVNADGLEWIRYEDIYEDLKPCNVRPYVYPPAILRSMKLQTKTRRPKSPDQVRCRVRVDCNLASPVQTAAVNLNS
ncbi:hypothetical protein C8R47DRAFT_1322530 [Mycena vitilis]|nr:hypothetical protein C8R47DRAFT_1322530 [Mycena vitilis]